MANNYEQAISDSSTLYSILQKHLVGNASSLIDSCNYLNNKDRYQEAINILTEMYGNRSSVLKAYRKRLNSNFKIGENLTDFINIQNKLCCFKNVVAFYQDERSVVSGILFAIWSLKG